MHLDEILDRVIDYFTLGPGPRVTAGAARPALPLVSSAGWSRHSARLRQRRRLRAASSTCCCCPLFTAFLSRRRLRHPGAAAALLARWPRSCSGWGSTRASSASTTTWRTRTGGGAWPAPRCSSRRGGGGRCSWGWWRCWRAADARCCSATSRPSAPGWCWPRPTSGAGRAAAFVPLALLRIEDRPRLFSPALRLRHAAQRGPEGAVPAVRGTACGGVLLADVLATGALRPGAAATLLRGRARPGLDLPMLREMLALRAAQGAARPAGAGPEPGRPQHPGRLRHARRGRPLPRRLHLRRHGQVRAVGLRAGLAALRLRADAQARARRARWPRVVTYVLRGLRVLRPGGGRARARAGGAHDARNPAFHGRPRPSCRSWRWPTCCTASSC